MFKTIRVSLLCFLISLPVLAQGQTTTKVKIERQESTALQTEKATKRLETLLNILSYYNLNDTEESKLVVEATTVLKSLRQQDMVAVIKHLETSAKAKSKTTSDDETKLAYVRHQKILEKLRELAMKQQAIRSLEIAAERMAKASKEEFSINATLTIFYGMLEDKNSKTKSMFPTIVTKLIDRQRDLNVDVSVILSQAADLESKLDDQRKDRLKEGLRIAKAENIRGTLSLVTDHLSKYGDNQESIRNFKPASNYTEQNHFAMKKIADAWRAPKNTLQTLKELQDKVGKMVRDQKEINEKMKEEDAPKTPEAKMEVAKKEADMANVTKDILKTTEPAVQSAKPDLAKAEAALEEAAKTLAAAEDKKAEVAQDKALKALEAAKEKIDAEVAKIMEKAKDPVAKAQDLVNKIEKLEEKQKQVNETAKNMTKPEAKPDAKAAENIAKQEKDLAEKAIDTAKESPGIPEEVKKALEKAADAQEKAAEAAVNNPDPKAGLEKAAPKMKEALEELTKAKEAAKTQVAAEKAKADDVAKREKAADELAKAAEMQKEVAEKLDKAKQEGAMDALKSKDVAKNLAKDVQKAMAETEKAAKNAMGDAKEATDEAVKDQKDSEKALQNNDLAKAAEAAADAAEKLDMAAKDAAEMVKADKQDKAVAQAKEEMKQADVSEAARRVAQALDKNNEAEKATANAKEKLGEGKAEMDLAKKQGDLAKQLDNAKDKNPEAAEAAADAAKALAKGDVNKAIEAQKAALEGLNDSPEKGANEMANEQKALLEATQELAKAQDAANMAKDAAMQAEALVPDNLKGDLKAAEALLEKGAEAASKGNIQEAAAKQAEATKSLEKALEMLNELAKALDVPMGVPGETALAKADGKSDQKAEPSDAKAEPKDSPMPNSKQAETKGDGDRKPDGTEEAALAKLLELQANGGFLKLPEKEREALLQSLGANLPPEYSAMIQKYYRDLADKQKTSKAPLPSSR